MRSGPPQDAPDRKLKTAPVFLLGFELSVALPRQREAMRPIIVALRRSKRPALRLVRIAG
jgi:hypothetical protein